MADNIWAVFGTMPGGDEGISPPACIERALTYLSERDQRKIRKILHYTGLPCDARSVTSALLQMEDDHDLLVLRVGIDKTLSTNAVTED